MQGFTTGFPVVEVHMRESEATIAQLLKEAGYATCMSGKWHCNGKLILVGNHNRMMPVLIIGSAPKTMPVHPMKTQITVRNGQPVGEFK